MARAAMILGLLMLFGALGLGGWALLAPGSSGASPEPDAAPDPGIAACQTLATAASDPQNAPERAPAEVFAGFKASGNADLRSAVTVLEQAATMTEEEQLEALEELATAVGQVTSGCSALGVQLPTEAITLLD